MTRDARAKRPGLFSCARRFADDGRTKSAWNLVVGKHGMGQLCFSWPPGRGLPSGRVDKSAKMIILLVG